MQSVDVVVAANDDDDDDDDDGDDDDEAGKVVTGTVSMTLEVVRTTVEAATKDFSKCLKLITGK